METKTCIKCSRELPLSEFAIDARMREGHKSACKECTKAYSLERRKLKQEEKALTPLSKFTPRELIEELRARGYRGQLELV